MKKLFAFLLIAATVAMTADALSFSGKKWYVNPGHGGHDSNDRPTNLPNGQTPIFYESDGNLTRGLHVRDLFVKYGGSVKMSRTKNTSSDDLGLSTISAQSSSYGGYFLSNHTNTGNSSANYTIAFYWANATTAKQTAGQKMGKAVVDEHAKVSLTNTTYSPTRCVSDYSFMHFCYGVLRNNTATGYLLESWFHDYRPETLRLKNHDYNRFLAWQIVQGFAVYPQAGTGMKGGIVGDIRDTAKGCGYSDYVNRGRDSYLAINGAKVTLKDANGNTVSVTQFTKGSADDATYFPGQSNPQTTDSFKNGVYFFDELTAGTYTVEVSASGYATQSKTVTVTNDNITKACFDMKTGTSTGISVSPTAWEASTTVGSTATKSFTVTGTGLSSDITVASTNSNFKVSTTTLAKTGGSVTVTYQPTAAGNHSGNITFTSGSQKETVAVTGVAKNAPLTFTQGWNYSETTGQTPAWAADFTHMRNMTFGDGKLYVVDPGTAVNIINAQTGAKMGELSMNGVSGGALSLIDVKYVDGKIIGCNIATNASSLSTFKIYCWDNDRATPRVLLETTNIGGKARIGDCISLAGDLNNGSFSFAAGGTSEDNTVVTYKITNGVVSTTPTVVDLKDDGGTEGVKLGLSPRVIAESDGKYWAAGQEHYPIYFSEEGKEVYTLNPKAFADIAGNSFKAFTYKGTPYGFATDYTAGSTAAERLKGGKMILVDATNGWAQAEKVADYPSAGLGTTRNTSLSSSIEVAVNGNNGVEAWVLVHNQGIAYFKTGTPKSWNPKLSGDDGPTITANPAAVSLSAKQGASASANIAVTGSQLTGNITATISGTGAAAFSVNPASLASTGGTLAVTFAPTVASGTQSATLTLKSTGAADVNVALTGSVSANIDPSLFALEVIKETQTNLIAQNEGRFSTGFGGYNYVTDKENGQIVRYDATGAKSVFASVEGIGTAITSDDAGNILVNKGFPNTTSSANWVIIEPNGTQTALSLDGVSGRLDQVGRVMGDVTSSTGAYMFLAPNGGDKIVAVKIANKAVAGITQSLATGLTFDTSTLAQPRYDVATANSFNYPASASYLRKRSDRNIYQWGSGTAMESLGQVTGATNGEGFDVFVIAETRYAVEPCSGDNHYGDGFAIRNLTTNEIVASKNLGLKTDANPGFQSLTARVADDGSYVTIYQTLSGKLVAQYRYGMPSTPVAETVAAPVFSPVAGTYTAAQNVTISCATSGADIYYTLDGSAPTASSTKYTGPIAISTTTTVKAIAVKSGMNNSAVVSATYTISSAAEAPATPTFTPAAGTYSTAQNVTIACATEGAEIRYTLDGSNPTASSALYSGPIAVSQTTTIKAVAIKDGLSSAIAVAAYTIQSDTPEPSGLTLVWEQKFSTPASGDARFATGFNGAIYAAQKATSDAPGQILKYTKDGVTTFATVEDMGSAITSDDAGNILVNKGFPNATSAANWVIVEPNGTQHELTLTLPDGMESKRLDQVGRVVGNVMSADGGYFFLAYSDQTAVAAIKIANGAQDVSASAASPTVSVAMGTSTLAQPMFGTVEDTEAWVDPSTAFYSRQRSDKRLFSWLEDGSEQYAIDSDFGAGGNEGFDIVKYQDKLFGVVSLARTSEFTLRNITDGEQIAAGGSADEAVAHQFRAYTLRKDGNLCGIYVWNAGHSARYYTIALVSGVESVAGSDAVEVAATYYNLQGVRVANPSAGQIYIRVATLSDGSVRTSKVVVK